MKFTLAVAVLGSTVVPAFSLSYLESLNMANPVSVAPSGSSNGATYLDALTTPVSTAPTGGGITSYLDALPATVAPSSGGAGIGSYLETVAGGAPVAAAPVAAAPVAAAPVAAAPASSSTPVFTGNYLDALDSSASSAPTGAGVTGYLDALPRTSTVSGGAGIRAFTDNLPVTNTHAGAGMSSYSDALSGSSSSAKSSFSPFGVAKAASFSGSAGGSEIGFTLEASDLSALVEQLRGNGGTIRLSGSIEGISFN